MRPMVWLMIGIVGLCWAGKLTACDGCCAHCGCQQNCCKVCRLVPDKKKVPKVTYECECEDFCVPGPSKICGYKCECECECGHERCHEKPVFVPTCAKLYTRKKLVKKEEIKEVCSWKWVVEDLCPACKERCAEKPTDAEMAAAGEPTPVQMEAAEAPSQEGTASSEPKREAQLVSHTWKSKVKQKLTPLFGK